MGEKTPWRRLMITLLPDAVAGRREIRDTFRISGLRSRISRLGLSLMMKMCF